MHAHLAHALRMARVERAERVAHKRRACGLARARLRLLEEFDACVKLSLRRIGTRESARARARAASTEVAREMTMGLSRERASHRALEEAEMLEHGAFTHELGHAHHVPLVARVGAACA